MDSLFLGFVLPLLQGELDRLLAQMPLVGGGSLEGAVDELDERSNASRENHRGKDDAPRVSWRWHGLSLFGVYAVTSVYLTPRC